MSYNPYPSVASTSLATGRIAEEYYPLYVMSSSSAGNNPTTSGQVWLAKGSTTTSGTSVAHNLLPLSSTWNTSQNFAFEASIYTSSTSYTAYAALWDMTSNAIVTGSTISTTSATATLIRSGNVTLVPGHTYGVTIWTSNTVSNCNLTKAHLVALEM